MTRTGEDARYGFGKNWAEYIAKSFSDETVEHSRRHLSALLRSESLTGKLFLDIGCGSGIHSLAAIRMGASRVISFDYDADSVATTEKVRQIAGGPNHWEVMQGSVLDRDFMANLPKADIVYSWGVLHHTGDTWQAVRNAALPLKDDGLFYISLYSADSYVDPPPEYWLAVKRAYNAGGAFRKRLMEWSYFFRVHFVPAVIAGRNPLKIVREYRDRGMSYWTDVKDWLGGWPMDFISFAETRTFCRKELSLTLVNVLTGQGCTEYLFCKPEANPQWSDIIDQRTRIPLSGPFAHVGGSAYAVRLLEPDDTADSNEIPRRSQLMVYEDGIMLGLAHSTHDHIRRFGGGRFSHWGSTLHFSATDGSDPNSNGRQYSYCRRF